MNRHFYLVAGLKTVAMLSAIGGAVETHAQGSNSEASAARATQLAARFSISQTSTDNLHLTPVAQQSEQITEVSPGIRIASDGARFKGHLDYSLREISYAQGSSPRRHLNALNTAGELEVIDNWAFLEASGSISQQAISAFGTPSIGSALLNSNQAEVSNYRISPILRGHLGSLATYDIRYSRSTLQSDSVASLGVTTAESLVKVQGSSSFKSLGWSAEASRQNVDYSAGRSTEGDRASLGLMLAISPQLSLIGNLGRESNNYASLEKTDHVTSGLGVHWDPSESTKLAAMINRRSFGDAHSLTFEHRTPRTVWRVTDSKDISGTPSLTGPGSMGSAYDLYFSQFAAAQPDPLLRAEMVTAFLQSNGIRANETVTSSFLTSALSLQRRQELSFALIGVRDTVTFMAARTDSTRLDTLSTGIDDFNSSALIRQSGFSINLAHRLTPAYTLSVTGSEQYTSGLSAGQDSNLHSLQMSLTGKLGPRSILILGAQRNVSDGIVAPYGESSIHLLWIFQF